MSTTSPLHVLVSGGGIAGNAVALQLLRNGIRTTVVERATAPRPGGQAVDLRGPSKEAAERMGLMAGIAKYQLEERGMAYVDGDGKVYARMAMEDFDGLGAIADIEITRGDLNQVLLDELAAATDSGLLDYRYGEWIERIDQDATAAAVTFASGATERFDLVVGADGVHSATRRLAFGPEEQFSTNLGGYGAFFTMPSPPDVEPGWFEMRLIPGAMIGIRPDADPATCKAIITLRTDPDPALRRDVEAQRALLRRTLADAGWRAPAILAAMDSATDFYFDEVARVDVPELSAGRVTLIGDAGYCGSPMTGMGTAMAIVGAYVLAAEIAATPADLAGAQQRYQDKITPFLAKAKEIPGGGMKMMLPNTALMTALAKVNVRIMMSRPMRPLTKKIFFGHTEDFALPTY
ncbi:FAD-binding monooxygenase [Nocardia asteroides NBRC 15531]|uniref:Monooxygenase n=1 Tax=Nocardia asteroides NBRC 15531 TaxID=1110697 RepID=U5EIX0_NOCAS|nr:FAD-dependent monooxygenase [Nocardia asteroides]TLF67119.1 FAD-binding monooxygenase [Nocardia asteroides NBRC 15531]UGT51607.1 FAD-dependent monooxygenase [Nocardia asteroides]SFM21717.1 2-polyprenyl-6-methoxyphenol hydroxylase [Nocardia asteroides]VEG35494.1 6-hydroxynicotinate 3-monooxygenase precursor [Nocardia asteroides]GAD86346.1 putative monooxygenase [Nocardia asteroides NBRC 15531]